MKRDLGGSAFPYLNPRGFFVPGMLLVDYLVAHAPEVPEWFEPVMPGKPDAPFDRITDREKVKRLNEWEEERERQKVLQWPYWWAVEQIKVRNRILDEQHTDEALSAPPAAETGRDWKCHVCGALLTEPKVPHKTPFGTNCTGAVVKVAGRGP